MGIATQKPEFGKQSAEARAAAKLGRTFAKHHLGTVRLKVEEEEVLVPQGVIVLLAKTLSEYGEVGPSEPLHEEDELTTTEAAELLCVSRPTVMKLIASGAISHRMVGSHHRVNRAEVLAYKEKAYAGRRAALNELTAMSQEMGLYDDPVK